MLGFSAAETGCCLRSSKMYQRIAKEDTGGVKSGEPLERAERTSSLQIPLTARCDRHREGGENVSKDKVTVRKVLEAVRSSGETALTAPQGKVVCDAYGIPLPKEGLAKSAARGGPAGRAWASPS